MEKNINDALPIGTLLTSPKRTYRIEEVLGAGGFGITYKVSSEIMVDNVPVVTYFALKEHFVRKSCERKDSKVCSTSGSSADVEKSKANFISEAQRLNKLSASHTNIVRVNENFKANDTAYYVMEFIDGQDLRSLVRGGKPLGWDEAIRIIAPIAEAVSYLHDNRLTHLDIKPDNIILDAKKGNRPVLIDFGLSKHYDKKGEATSTVRVVGCSDGYSPMEQYVGISKFSPKADVYALAATLLFLLTGKDPAIATEMNEASVRAALSDDIPANAVSAIVNALRKEPAERTPTIRDFMAGLSASPAAVAQQEKDTKSTVIVPSEPKKPMSKTAWYCILGAIGAIIVAVGLYFLISDDGKRLADGSKFYGQLDDKGNPNGEGRLIGPAGAVYTGTWRNGTLATGVMTANGYQYEGQFYNLLPSGYGTAKYDDGQLYVGHWKNGEWNGLGKRVSPTGNISFGIYNNGTLSRPQPFTVGERVYGIDVSQWQKRIDWESLCLPAASDGSVATDGGEYLQPVLFALMKATDGKDKNDYYERNYSNAKRCGITCGAYHFFSMRCDVDTQVQSFIASAHLEAGDLPPVFDIELPNEVMKTDKEKVCEMALEWLEKIEQHYGVRPVIYSYYYFIVDYLTDPRFEKYDYFVAYHRDEPPAIGKWKFWQLTDKAKVPGITANTVDVDIFNGDYDEFRQYLNRNGIQ